MNKKMFYLIWGSFPLTKIVYIYLAYQTGTIINNNYTPISICFLLIGFVLSLISIYLSTKIYTTNSIFSNKLLNQLFNKKKLINTKTESESESESESEIIILFNTFVILLGFGETATLFGFIQFLITGNLYVFIILVILCLIVWIFNFPKLNKYEEYKKIRS